MTATAAIAALVLLAWSVQAGLLTPVLVVMVAAVLLWPAPTRTRPGRPGASAAARARRLRTPAVRIAAALGYSTRRGRLADRYAAGAAGEEYVARLLARLEREGWQFLYDRALPHSDANVDVIAISPRGIVYILDPKQWSARHRLRVVDGRLLHGQRDVTARLGGLKYETRQVARLLDVRPVPVVVMVGALTRGLQLRVDGIRIVPADDVCDVLRRLDAQQAPQQRRPDFMAAAARALPPYTGR